MGWAHEAGKLVIVLQQLKLSIEETHNANDGNAKGSGEEQFVEHLFLLFSNPNLGQTIMIFGAVYKPVREAKTGTSFSKNSIASTKNSPFLKSRGLSIDA